MATKKASGPVRGAALVKKAIEAAGKEVSRPEPVAPLVLKKLRLPNDEKLPAGLKTLLAWDTSYISWSIDDEEPELEAMSFDEAIAQELGDEAVSAFGEACELFDGDCVMIDGGAGDARRMLYVGTPDDEGEYPVLTFSFEDGVAWVGGFVPFDVWIAQRFGVVAAEEPLGSVPDEYLPVVQSLADSNGDGRRSFNPEHRHVADRDGDDDDDDEEETKGV